jgi:hypothetical protein
MSSRFIYEVTIDDGEDEVLLRVSAASITDAITLAVETMKLQETFAADVVRVVRTYREDFVLRAKEGVNV